MTIDIDKYLVEAATKITRTTNEFGDVDYGGSTSVSCLYRDISTLHQAANQNNVTLDGILWFAASATVNKGDIYHHADEGYLKIMRVLPAKRRLVDNTKQFIRCEVVKQRQLS